IQKVMDALAGHGHSKTIIGVRQTGHENLALYNFPGLHINIRMGLARKVDEKLVAGHVGQHH
ncbi:MAG: hypothetical protein PF489_08225, partial [Salinivirgaceae bacterium]|nr:hypothetical protein [Salinivirgaceae bacterium]